MAKDNELWDIVLDGPFILTTEVKEDEINKVMPQAHLKYTKVFREKIDKNFKAKNLLVCGIGAEEYNRIYAY